MNHADAVETVGRLIQDLKKKPDKRRSEKKKKEKEITLTEGMQIKLFEKKH